MLSKVNINSIQTGQAIIWTDVVLVYWRIYVSLGLDNLKFGKEMPSVALQIQKPIQYKSSIVQHCMYPGGILGLPFQRGCWLKPFAAVPL